MPVCAETRARTGGKIRPLYNAPQCAIYHSTYNPPLSQCAPPHYKRIPLNTICLLRNACKYTKCHPRVQPALGQHFLSHYTARSQQHARLLAGLPHE